MPPKFSHKKEPITQFLGLPVLILFSYLLVISLLLLLPAGLGP